jgi:hypothetical protein
MQFNLDYQRQHLSIELLGRKKEELIKKNIYDLFHKKWVSNIVFCSGKTNKQLSLKTKT